LATSQKGFPINTNKTDSPIDGWSFEMHKDVSVGSTTLALGLTIAALALWPGVLTWILLALALVVWGMVMYFFRDPSRQPPDDPTLILSPADGKVVEIITMQEDQYLKEEVIRVSIFLNVNDVHVQRAPVEGEVILVEHKPGKYLQAFRPEASKVNEYIAMRIETPVGPFLVKQISGILARRCVNYAKPGDRVERGQRYGLIKFGSRVDLFIPPEVEVVTKVGERVYGGLTPIARIMK
jgi:phosphatidylserine decarboxylase